jgi:FdrA protein
MLKSPVYSNAPLTNETTLTDSTKSYQHSAVDLGEEEFTVGRPHPMIDNDLRVRRLLQEARDPQVAVIMLDVVLGYGAHPDPASELGNAVETALKLGRSEKREVLFIASVTGTEDDPQSLSRTASTLERAGVIVCNSNSAAARLSGLIVSGNRGG